MSHIVEEARSWNWPSWTFTRSR